MDQVADLYDIASELELTGMRNDNLLKAFDELDRLDERIEEIKAEAKILTNAFKTLGVTQEQLKAARRMRQHTPTQVELWDTVWQALRADADMPVNVANSADIIAELLDRAKGE